MCIAPELVDLPVHRVTPLPSVFTLLSLYAKCANFARLLHAAPLCSSHHNQTKQNNDAVFMLTDDRCQCVLRTQPVEFPVFISPSPARSFPPLFVLALFPSLLSGEASIASNSSQSQTSSLINGRGSRLPSSPVLIAAIKSPFLPTNTRATYYPSAVSSFPPHTTG